MAPGSTRFIRRSIFARTDALHWKSEQAARKIKPRAAQNPGTFEHAFYRSLVLSFRRHELHADSRDEFSSPARGGRFKGPASASTLSPWYRRSVLCRCREELSRGHLLLSIDTTFSTLLSLSTPSLSSDFAPLPLPYFFHLLFFISFFSSSPPPHGSFTMRLSFSLSQKDGILCSMLPTRRFSLHRLRELSFSPLFAVSGKTLGGFSPFRESYSTLASFEIRCLFVVEYLLRLPAWLWSCILSLELRVWTICEWFLVVSFSEVLCRRDSFLNLGVVAMLVKKIEILEQCSTNIGIS